MARLLALFNITDNTTIPRILGTIFIALTSLKTVLDDVLLPAVAKLLAIVGGAPPPA